MLTRIARWFPKETVRMALGSVLAHKFRSFLTVLGIVIGVATVVAVASLLTGLRNNIVQLVEEYGTNNIYAFHLSGGFGGPEPEQEPGVLENDQVVEAAPEHGAPALNA